MINNERTGLCLFNEILDDLINAESEATMWSQQLYEIHTIISDELLLLNFETDTNKATYKLLDMQVKADELMQKLTELKNSPVLAFTNERLDYLNELEQQLLLVINKRLTSMLLTRDDGSTIDLFNLNFTKKEKRLPRKQKKVMKKTFDRDERALKEWGAIY